MILISIVT